MIDSDSNNTFVCTRRKMLGMSAAALAFANFPGRVFSDSSESGPVDLRYAPQFYVGQPDAAFRIDIAWSIRCGYSHKLFKNGVDPFVKQIFERDDTLLVFHHLCRYKKEIGNSEVFLSLDPTYYGPACMVSMRHFAEKEKFPTKSQLKKFLKKLDLPNDPNFNKKAAKNASILLNNYLVKDEQINKTPALRIGQKWIIGASPEDFAQALKESGYES